MAWISLTIVLFVFYLPGVGLADQILAQSSLVTISLPWMATQIPILFINDLKVLLLAFLAWAVLWIVLVGLLSLLPAESVFHRLFRGSELFADRPHVTIRMANLLSLFVLSFLVIFLILLLVASLLALIFSGLAPFKESLLRLPVPTEVYVIAALVQAAVRAWTFEVAYRKDAALKRIQTQRRRASEIVLPSSQYE